MGRNIPTIGAAVPGFAAAVTCIDGRFHTPLVAWARSAFGVDHVDLVTAPGVSAALASGTASVRDAVLGHLAPSFEAHHAGVVVLAAHEGCAADPSAPDRQRDDLKVAATTLQASVGDRRRVAAVYLRADGTVEPLTADPQRPPTHRSEDPDDRPLQRDRHARRSA